MESEKIDLLTAMDQKEREIIEKDLSNTYLVEAGAGTGKTTLLISRILEIIRSGKANILQIVAITFTEKAATELKTRIKYKLEFEIKKEPVYEIRLRMEQALFDIERANITTIHSFCSSLLREKSIEMGIEADFDVANEMTSGMIYQKSWNDWIESEIKNKSDELKYLLKMGVSIEQIEDICRLLLNHRETVSLQIGRASCRERV